MKKYTLCVTGGHLTPALAVIEEIQTHHPAWNIFFIGRSQAFEAGGSPAQEERLIRALGIPFHPLFTGRQGSSLWKFSIGLFQSFFLLASNRPTAVLSFGGYIALPVAIAAWILRIPIITHEQTDELGLANRIIARFARRVFFAREIGVPIRNALFHPPAEPSFPIDVTLPLIYITGGSTGAMSLNSFVYPNIEKLTRTYCVIHQVGVFSKAEALRMKDMLPKALHSRYVVVSYLDTPDVAWTYHHAKLIIGRAGANTVAEVAALGLPALFVPLPWAAGNEQSLNAARLEKLGSAVVLNQRAITPVSFMMHAEKMLRNIHRYQSAALKEARQISRSAGSIIVSEIFDTIDSKAS